MTEKWKKEKSNKLLAPKVQCQQLKRKKKKSIAKVLISNGGGQNKKKSDQICKGKCFSNNPTQQQMDIDQEAIKIYFEEEIIMDILSRLPVQSLLRFKCVSNIWKVLISDPYFKKKHLKYANNDQNSQKLLISQMFIDKDDMLFSFHCSSLSSVQVVEDEQKLDCPLNYKPRWSELYCCCDGLVLLTINDQHLLLWNPSTRESVVLPCPESSFGSFVCGLGYDATSNDYKILAINLKACHSLKVSAEILALKSGSWRNVNEYSSHIRRVDVYMDGGMDSLAFVHGTFHWLGLSQWYTIVSFNISNEVYGEVPMLERMCDVFELTRITYGVSVLKGMLCFYSTYHSGLEHTFKLWQMKDYGVKQSWTQSLTIEDPNLCRAAYPKCMFVDGEVILHCKNPGFIGTIVRTSRGPFDLCHRRCFTYGVVYTESLISPRFLI